jgi:hypothetical protein
VRIHRLPPSRIPCACSFNPVLHSYIPYYCSARQRVAPCDEERTHARARTHEHARACAGARAEEEEEEETTEGDGPIIAEEPLNVVGTQHNTQGTLRGTRGVLEGTLQGTRGVLEGYSRVLEGYSAGYSRGTLRGTRGVLEGTQHHTLTRSGPYRSGHSTRKRAYVALNVAPMQQPLRSRCVAAVQPLRSRCAAAA